MDKAETLQRATDAVVDRNGSYGDIRDCFQRTADFWNTWLEQRGVIRAGSPKWITPLDIAMMNVLQKAARLAETPGHEDSIVDIAGYAACYAECATPQTKPKDNT